MIREKVKEGGLVFPVSETHCMEMIKHESPDWRRKLWTFVLSVSQCNAILPKYVVLESLIEQAFCYERGVVDVFSKSCLFGLWSPKEFPLTHEASQTEAGWLHFWLDVPEDMRDRLFNGLRIMEEKFVTRRNKIKEQTKGEPDDIQRRTYMVVLFYELQDFYIRTARKYGVAESCFMELSLDKMIHLITEVPPLDVECALAVQHLKQWDKPERANDVRDITHLCMAVPYCDVVVTERYWIDKLRREKIDTKYKTNLLPNLEQLESLLISDTS